MTRSSRWRVLAGAVGVLTLISVGTVGATPTDAAWTEAEHARSTAISAATLAAPSNVTCQATSVLVLGLQSVKLTWSSPQQGAQRVQIARGANVGTDVQNTTGSVIAQTGSSGGLYHYEAVYSTAKLLGLVNLVDLLGGTYTIRIFNGAGTEWVSAPKTYNLNVVPLGLGSSCAAA